MRWWLATEEFGETTCFAEPSKSSYDSAKKNDEGEDEDEDDSRRREARLEIIGESHQR